MQVFFDLCEIVDKNTVFEKVVITNNEHGTVLKLFPVGCDNEDNAIFVNMFNIDLDVDVIICD